MTLPSPLFALLPEHERSAASSPRSVSLDATMWPDLVREVRKRFPALAELVFSNYGSVQNGFVLVLNNDIMSKGDPPLVLHPTDRLFLIAQIAGG